jgi:arsenite methyltransferase
MDELTIRQGVRDAYGRRASTTCCAPSNSNPSEFSAVPKFGVAPPLPFLRPRSGEVIVDLGSGPGRDALEAAALVGSSGRVIGVDATPEMIYAARERAAHLGLTNVEFRLGEIEHLPIESSIADGIGSDCVINLSPDKAQVFREAYRVLRPGGRIVVSDVVADTEPSASERQDLGAWCACAAGAVTEADYLSLLGDAGFEEVAVALRGGRYAENLSISVVTARKPGSIETK